MPPRPAGSEAVSDPLSAGFARRLAPVGLALTIAIPFPSHAQSGVGWGGKGGLRSGRGEGRASATERTADDSREDPGLAVLRGLDETLEQLRLLPGQRDAWARYADRVTALAADFRRSADPARLEGKPAPRQLDALADAARNRLAAVEDVAEAGKALYDALTEEQRALADGRLARIALPLVEPGPASGRIASRRGSE